MKVGEYWIHIERIELCKVVAMEWDEKSRRDVVAWNFYNYKHSDDLVYRDFRDEFVLFHKPFYGNVEEVELVS